MNLATDSLPAGGIAHLIGTDKFIFTEKQREELKRFVTSGGTLLIDAAGGSVNFAQAAETELALIFTGLPLDTLPEDHLLYSPGGKKIAPIRYRRLARVGAIQIRVPRLRGIILDKRVAVILSREDLSTGVVGQSVEGVNGYEPNSATNAVAAIVVYVVGSEKSTTKPTTGATTQPTTKPATAKKAASAK